MWRKYADFNGRDTRAEYWYAFLVNFIIGAVLSAFSRASGFFTVISGLYSLAAVIPGLALFTRRLHDVGKSGKLWLVTMIPIVLTYAILISGILGQSMALIILGLIFSLASLAVSIYIIVLLAKQGDFGENKYGADPRTVDIPIPAPAANAVFRCPACGCEYDKPASFCTRCGAKMD
jgi:uncharacterized membrane protein YhaH (DUF805 family)